MWREQLRPRSLRRSLDSSFAERAGASAGAARFRRRAAIDIEGGQRRGLEADERPGQTGECAVLCLACHMHKGFCWSAMRCNVLMELGPFMPTASSAPSRATSRRAAMACAWPATRHEHASVTKQLAH